MTQYTHFSIQLKSAVSGAPIVTSGGRAIVTKNATPTKHTLYADRFGTSATNPRALTRGKLDFWVDTSTLVNGMVDLYIQCPGDQFLVVKDVSPSGNNEYVVPDNRPHQVMVIPIDAADYTAATETDVGFDEPAANTAMFVADSTGGMLRITAIHSAKTLDVGTLSTETGDADGFMSAVSVATLGLIQDTSTVGALLTTLVGHASGGKSISITTSSGTTTFKGFVSLPYVLAG